MAKKRKVGNRTDPQIVGVGGSRYVFFLFLCVCFFLFPPFSLPAVSGCSFAFSLVFVVVAVLGTVLISTATAIVEKRYAKNIRRVCFCLLFFRPRFWFAVVRRCVLSAARAK